LFFLNPDTELLGDVVQEFRAQLSEHRAQIIGGNLIGADGHSVFSYGNLPTIRQQVFDLGLNKLFPRYYRKVLSPSLAVSSENLLIDAGYICGANLFLSRELFNKVGGFDEEFFMYWEEVDLCKRLQKEHRAQLSVIRDARILHHESASTSDESGTINYNKYQMLEKSKYLYFKKHFGSWSVTFLKIVQIISLILHTPFTNQRLIRSIKITSHS